MTFGQALALVHDGRLTFNDFISHTRDRWRRFALYLARKWRGPAWHSVEDIEQDLYLGVWSFLWRYDDFYAKKVTLERYVVFNALDFAKKNLHRARGASLSGSADRNPSHIEPPFASWDEDGQAHLESLLTSEATQFDTVVSLEAVARAKRACTSVRELHSVDALARTGDIGEAALRLYGDFDTRLACRFMSEAHAVRVVDAAADAVAQRLAG